MKSSSLPYFGGTTHGAPSDEDGGGRVSGKYLLQEVFHKEGGQTPTHKV